MLIQFTAILFVLLQMVKLLAEITNNSTALVYEIMLLVHQVRNMFCATKDTMKGVSDSVKIEGYSARRA